MLLEPLDLLGFSASSKVLALNLREQVVYVHIKNPAASYQHRVQASLIPRMLKEIIKTIY